MPQLDTFQIVLLAAGLIAAVTAVTATILAWLWRGPEDTIVIAYLRVLNRLYCRLFHGVWRRREEDPLPPEGPAIVVANHQSGVDPHLLAAITWRWIRFLMAKEYYETRGLRWLFRLLRVIPVRRDGKDLGAVRAALRELRDGHVVGIFPQGGIRDPSDELAVGKAGVALLALRTGAPVIPVYIAGSPICDSVFGALLKPSRSRLLCGEPLRFEATVEKPTREELDHVTREVLAALLRLRERALGGAETAAAERR